MPFSKHRTKPGKVYRITRPNVTNAGNLGTVINDPYGRRVLSDPSLVSNVLEPLKVHHTKIIAFDGESMQVIELVDRFKGTPGKDLLSAQGGKYTRGQQLAYVVDVRELNKRGVVAMDLHSENVNFVQLSRQDRWRMQIVDPGGMYPAKGATAIERMATATRMQNDAFKPYAQVKMDFAE